MKPLKFKKGALHAELGVPQGQKIPAGKMRAAASGADGPLAEKRADFARNVLHDKVGVKDAHATVGGLKGPNYAHLGHFRQAAHINRGHNSVRDVADNTRVQKVLDPYPSVSDNKTY